MVMTEEMQIKVVTYEEEKLVFFVTQMQLAKKRYDRIFKTFKNAPYGSEGSIFLADSARELQFYVDVVEVLEKGYHKQSEGEWVYAPSNECIDGTDAPLNYKCSLCGEYEVYPRKYCPDCGAKMKGDKE